MKLVKMSLAAIVAAGALSSVASATPLEEAIKNVDVSGWARYRFTSTQTDTDGVTPAAKAEHRFTSTIDFKAALDDNFFGVIGFRYDSIDASGDSNNGTTNVGQNDNGFDNYGQTFNVRQFLLGYKAGNTTIQAGRQVLGTFFTDDMVGTGIKILNTDITGLTLAAVAFDDLQHDTHIGTGKAFNFGTAVNDLGTYNNNLYGVAAIGSYDPVSFQLWYAMLQDVTDLYAVDVAVNFDVNDFNLGLHGQYAGSSIDSDFKAKTGNLADDADFWAIEATAKAYGVDARVGYVDFSADGKDKVSVISYEDQGKFIEAGEDLYDTYSLFMGDNKYWFLVAGYTFDKFRVGVDYVDGKITKKAALGEQDAYELVGRLSYKYSKKLNFQTWWSHYEIDGKNGINDIDRDRFRFEAKYSF
ncbi:major outer membrane protein [Campylobacter hyointestinalis]|uniref:major outer membrane protein n=1 Tax=Campylobacter hyointestinalis TaxID=198 RepID=UPI000726BB48|nr:major outer membrane protein [Campylobacter hyointestinalis]CUU82754.1 major outer membrane protein [Campylobacter hyointestinalis subsp. hyointestinalis]